MTWVLSFGSTSTSNCLQPGSLRAAAALSASLFMNDSTFSGLIRISTCRTNISSLRVRGRDFRPDALDNEPVVLGPAVRGEVEHRLLQVRGEVDVGVADDDLVLLRLALRRDLAGGRDDERVA